MTKRRSQCNIPGPVDQTPYGRQLAERVADYLLVHKEIAYSHPYYCGMGLFFKEGAFLYADVWDAGLGLEGTHVIFPDREAFVAWLSAQSDDSLYGHEAKNPWLRGNQRITRARLESHLSEAKEQATPDQKQTAPPEPG